MKPAPLPTDENVYVVCRQGKPSAMVLSDIPRTIILGLQARVHALEGQPAKNSGGAQSGQALLEFALVLLFVILPFMFVLIDGAVTLYTQAVLTNATREGARAGSIYQATTAPSPNQTFADQVAAIDAGRASYVRQETQRLIGPLVSFSQCTHTITYVLDPPTIGNPYRELDSLTVSLTCPRQLFFGLVGTSRIMLVSQATMRIEPGGVAPSPTLPGP